MATDLKRETNREVPILFCCLLGFFFPGVSASVSSTPVQFCRNGGTWQNGRCICTEEWKGLRCTIGKLLDIYYNDIGEPFVNNSSKNSGSFS